MKQIEQFKPKEVLTSDRMNELVAAINLLVSGQLNPTFSHEGNKLYVSFPEITNS